jgi:hypothetical protein
MTFIPPLSDIIREAWNRTRPCKDGVYTDSPFCPSCLIANIAIVGNDAQWVQRLKERYDRLDK